MTRLREIEDVTMDGIWLFDTIRECGGYIDATVAKAVGAKLRAALAADIAPEPLTCRYHPDGCIRADVAPDDEGLDVERLAAAMVRPSGRAGHPMSEAWRDGSTYEIAKAIAAEDALIRREPVGDREDGNG